jgi:ferredoxin
VVGDAGVSVPSSCREGICGTCETRVVEGVPDHRDALLSDAEKQANRTMMICCSGSKSARLVLDL